MITEIEKKMAIIVVTGMVACVTHYEFTLGILRSAWGGEEHDYYDVDKDIDIVNYDKYNEMYDESY